MTVRTRSIGVVGAGILGLAVARRLAQLRPDLHITVVDKERDVAVHQTGHNSGVVHAGLYYAPGSLKAEFCARGRVLLREFCAEHALAYDECGKFVVARRPDELPALREIERRATANRGPWPALAVRAAAARDRTGSGRRGGPALSVHRDRRLPSDRAGDGR